MRKSSIKKLIIKVGGMKFLNKLTILKWLLKLKMNKYKDEKEMYLLANYIFNGDVCIDIGANYGAYTYEFSKIVGMTGRVYSFEPGKFAFNVLNATVRKLKNVYHYNIALSDKRGYRNLIVPFDENKHIRSALAHFSNEENEEGIIEKVPTITLDQFTLEKNIKKIKFIKCDVEGAELLVFKGAKSILLKQKPIILCEIDPRYTKRFGYTPNELISFLAKFDYKLFIIDDKTQLKSIVKINKNYNNYIFIAKQSHLYLP